MNYNEALEFIHSRIRIGIKPGTARTQALLDILGNPEKKMKFVHIAGTSGKGSATTITASILKSAGYKTGRYLSPYIERFNERMGIDGEDIADGELARLTEKVKKAAEELDATERFTPVTEFEIVTAIAFTFFYENKCDIVALEVGLGGRLDATNVIDTPLASVIMPISYDHTEILGETLSQIAFEKCGIIKKGGTTVMYPLQEKEAEAVILRRAEEEGNRVIVPDTGTLTILAENLFGETFRYRGMELHCSLGGTHQIYNCITAIEAALSLRDHGYKITDEAVQKGISAVRFFGRSEVLQEKPLIVIDGGHNEAKVESFAQVIEKHISGRYKTVRTIMGMLKDKDYRICMKRIAELSDVFVLVSPDSKRALPAKEAYEVAKSFCRNTTYSENLNEAIDGQLSQMGVDDALLVCGSLYLIGDARVHIHKRIC